MKKTVFLVLTICFIASLAIAQDMPAAEPAAENLTITGVIIDNMCAGEKTPEELAAFVKTHTKECATKPECAATGYSIFADGKLMKINAEGNEQLGEFLKDADSNLEVVVVAEKVGDEIAIISIENQVAEAPAEAATEAPAEAPADAPAAVK